MSGGQSSSGRLETETFVRLNFYPTIRAEPDAIFLKIASGFLVEKQNLTVNFSAVYPDASSRASFRLEQTDAEARTKLGHKHLKPIIRAGFHKKNRAFHNRDSYRNMCSESAYYSTFAFASPVRVSCFSAPRLCRKLGHQPRRTAIARENFAVDFYPRKFNLRSAVAL